MAAGSPMLGQLSRLRHAIVPLPHPALLHFPYIVDFMSIFQIQTKAASQNSERFLFALKLNDRDTWSVEQFTCGRRNYEEKHWQTPLELAAIFLLCRNLIGQFDGSTRSLLCPPTPPPPTYWFCAVRLPTCQTRFIQTPQTYTSGGS